MIKFHHAACMALCAAVLLMSCASANLSPPSWGTQATVRFNFFLDTYQFDSEAGQVTLRYPTMVSDLQDDLDLFYDFDLPGYAMVSLNVDCFNREVRIGFEVPSGQSTCFRAPFPQDSDADICPLDDDALQYFARLVYMKNDDDDDIAAPLFNGTVRSLDTDEKLNFWTIPTVSYYTYDSIFQYWESADADRAPVAVSFSYPDERPMALYVTDFSNQPPAAMAPQQQCHRKSPGYPRGFSDERDFIRASKLISNLFKRMRAGRRRPTAQ